MDTNLLFTFCSLTVAFINAVSLSYIRKALRFLYRWFAMDKRKVPDPHATRNIADLIGCEPVKERASVNEPGC
jgi:hypothetical protein